MNWKATGWTLLVIGAALAVAGFVWAGNLHQEASDCRVDNLFGARECTATSTPGWVLAGIGGGVVLLAIALLVGAVSRPRQIRS